jgi:hypothetical protein
MRSRNTADWKAPHNPQTRYSGRRPHSEAAGRKESMMERDQQVAADVGAHDVKFALTGIGIIVAIALLLMIFS